MQKSCGWMNNNSNNTFLFGLHTLEQVRVTEREEEKKIENIKLRTVHHSREGGLARISNSFTEENRTTIIPFCEDKNE